MKRTALPSVISRALQLRETLSVVAVERYSKSWLTACEVDQHSDTTLSFRRNVIAKLLWFLRRENYEECGVDELRAFLSHITNGHKEPGGRFGNPQLTQKAKPSTVATYHRDLRAFCNWITNEGGWDISPMERIPTPEHRDDQVQPFTPEQIDALLGAAKKGGAAKRDAALLLFMLDTGLRAEEVCSLRIADIDLATRELTVLGKGRKKRSVHISKTTAKAIYDYFKAVPREPHDALFESRLGEPLTRSGLYQLYARLGDAANITGMRCSPHTMRHTFAVEFLRGGGGEFALMTLLGHTDLKMTQRYVRFAAADIRNQHQRHSPVDRWRSRKNK